MYQPQERGQGYLAWFLQAIVSTTSGRVLAVPPDGNEFVTPGFADPMFDADKFDVQIRADEFQPWPRLPAVQVRHQQDDGRRQTNPMRIHGPHREIACRRKASTGPHPCKLRPARSWEMRLERLASTFEFGASLRVPQGVGQEDKSHRDAKECGQHSSALGRGSG
jgi:hypothetical protein